MSDSKGKGKAPVSYSHPGPNNLKPPQAPTRSPFEGQPSFATSPQFAGESTYEGRILPGQYSKVGCTTEEEYVRIQLDDGRVVGDRGRGAQELRLAIGFWNDNMRVKVTLSGTTDHIKRVETLTTVVGLGGLDAELTVEDLG